MTVRYGATEAADELRAVRTKAQELAGEVARLQAALATIANSPDTASVLRHIARRAVEGGRGRE